MPWRGPRYPGEVPTLGYGVLEWMPAYLVVPDGPTAGEPFEPTREQAQFILDFYRVDPGFTGPVVRGRTILNSRAVNRGVLSRPKGWGKSPLLAALSLVEAFGPVVQDGWDPAGDPVAVPWVDLGFKARVQILATSQDQTDNTWDPLLDMARNSPALLEDYHVDPLETFVVAPRVRLEYTTSAGDSREGGRPVFAVFDQTESWRRSNGGVGLAAAVRRNLTKTQGSSVETPNAFVPGEGSVAEQSFTAHATQLRLRRRDPSTPVTVHLDHREAPADTDIYDPVSLREGLRAVYGDSADDAGGWVNLGRVVEDFWDPSSTVEDSRRYFLNQVAHRVDSWVSSLELRAVRADRPVADGEAVTLGFDGSRGRRRGVTDATALIACTVVDGHVFEPFPTCVWEQPHGWDRNRVWSPPVDEVEAAVEAAFRRWDVVAFYADPARWESYVAVWEARYGPRLRVKASAQHPVEWWMVGGRSTRTAAVLERFRNAVVDRDLTYDGGLALTAHLLNARMVRRAGSGVQIAKPHPDSERKIDAAVAAVLAWQGRLDAVAAGVSQRGPVRRRHPVRLR